MTKKELAQIMLERKLAEASLEFSYSFEALRKKFKLTHKQCAELLQDQETLYFNIAWRKAMAHGRRS